MQIDQVMPAQVSADERIDPTAITQFHAAIADAFATACHRARVHTRTFQIGSGIVRMEFAGEAMIAPTTRALEHLRVTDDRDPDLSIGIWEIASLQSELPPPPWGTNAYLNRGEILGFNTDTHITIFNPDGRILFVYDVNAARAFVTAFDHTHLPAYERAAPLRSVLARYLEIRGIQYLHAAAVGLPQGGVLITGKSGKGKSTSSLACLDSELAFAGDDYCAASFRGAPTAYSLYSSAKGHPDTIRRLPFLEPLVSNPETMARDKAIWFLQEHYAPKMIPSFPLRAILMPHITGATNTHLVRATSQAALLALAPSTVSQVPNAGTHTFQYLAALVRQVPAYAFNVGTDLAQIPQAILKLIREGGA